MKKKALTRNPVNQIRTKKMYLKTFYTVRVPVFLFTIKTTYSTKLINNFAHATCISIQQVYTT